MATEVRSATSSPVWRLAAAVLALAAPAATRALASDQDVGPAREEAGAAASAPADTDESMARFRREMAMAAKARDRDKRIAHYRNALACRPNHPQNILLEFKIAVMLSQVRGGSGLDRPQALAIYQGILGRYNHMDYYQEEPADSINSPQMMMPEAAIHCACLVRGGKGDNAKARAYLRQAMEHLAATCERRKKDWSAPAPPPPPDVPWGGLPKSTPESRRQYWEKRHRAAAEGDVFNYLEMAITKAAVRQYGYTFGPQRPHEVAIPMGQIIRDFPNTPMAKVAQGHIDRATKMMDQELFGNLDHMDVEPLPVPEQSPTTRPATAPASAPHASPAPAPAHSEPRRAGSASKNSWVVALAVAVLVVCAAAVAWAIRRRRGRRRSTPRERSR